MDDSPTTSETGLPPAPQGKGSDKPRKSPNTIGSFRRNLIAFIEDNNVDTGETIDFLLEKVRDKFLEYAETVK